MSGRGTQRWTYSDNSPKVDNLVAAVRGETMDALLYDLLHHGAHHPHEEPVRKVIRAWCKNINYPEDQILQDEKGNLILEVQKLAEDGTYSKSPHIFMCHMDTVHQGYSLVYPYFTKSDKPDDDGLVYGMQEYYTPEYFNKETNIAYTSADLKDIAKAHGHFDYDMRRIEGEKNKYQMYAGKSMGTAAQREPVEFYCGMKATNFRRQPSVLGADDKLGCWILCKMLEAGIPGLYIFHVGEECGSHGSRYITEKKPSYLDGRKFAIAFDRKDYCDIIAHQHPGRCASTAATEQLAKMLNEQTGITQPMMKYRGNQHGTFTDSANYEGFIAECMNVSIGYFQQHGPSEHFDYVFLTSILMPALLKVKWDELVAVRKPGETERTHYYRANDTYESMYGGYDRWGHETVGEDGLRAYDIIGNGKKGRSSTGNYRVRNAVKFTAEMQTDQFWEGYGVVAPWAVTATTPDYMLPPWAPEIGVYPNTPQVVMRRIIKNSILNGPNGMDPGYIANLLCEMAVYQQDLETKVMEKIRLIA